MTAPTKSPMMRQYDQAKQACGEALLLFRMGDFYELFYDDAKIAANTLGLTLTSRDKGENAIPMAGFPHHQLDGYLAKLIKAGHRVGVCDQVQDPREAKGLVKREVTRVVSPGTITDQELLDPRESNFLVGVHRLSGKSKAPASPSDKHRLGLSWMDLSTGAFAATMVSRDQLGDLLSRLSPSEVLLSEEAPIDLPGLSPQPAVTSRPNWSFAHKHAHDLLLKHFKVATLDGFGFVEDEHAAIGAAGAVLDYVRETQNGSLDFVHQLVRYRSGEAMEIDQATWRGLEITRTIRTNERTGSLIDVIDRTMTSMGARLLATWLSQPLTSKAGIDQRLNAVEELHDSAALRKSLRAFLKDVHDVQRLLARVASGRTTPRDLSSICKTLGTLPGLKDKLTGTRSRLLQQIEADLDLCAKLRDRLQESLEPECPLQSKEGGFIKTGFDERLDELRQLASGGKQWIAKYQGEISAETGIANLKVGFNRVFGYYLEVTNLHRDRVPDSFQRKQTLKNAERFITPELKEYEERVLTADEQSKDLEYEIFCGLRQSVQEHSIRLRNNADLLAQLDVLAGLAELASLHNYVKPQIVEDSIIEIVDGRHPVLDITRPLGSFVPNSTAMDVDAGMIHLITGPNMAGKSTYIRQVALIVLLSHVGSFVPASSARIGLTDRLFARVGANDELSRGQSTFMVEMTETARILNNGTSRSLVILDEIGRGTSTYDGVSLAWAIVEYLHEHLGCRTLFATHYHELTKLDETLGGVQNFNVSVQEWEDQIVFLHKIIPGGADKSYGIHVAQLAGVPDWVNHRAEQILRQLEHGRGMDGQVSSAASQSKGEIQLTLFDGSKHPLIEKIQRIDTNHLTPLNALSTIQQWQQELTEDEVISKPNS